MGEGWRTGERGDAGIFSNRQYRTAAAGREAVGRNTGENSSRSLGRAGRFDWRGRISCIAGEQLRQRPRARGRRRVDGAMTFTMELLRAMTFTTELHRAMTFTTGSTF